MKDKYAVIQLKDKQFMVKEGDKFKVHELSPEDKAVVLLYKDGSNLKIGEPIVEGCGLELRVLENKKIKTDVRRFKSKSRYRRNRSHSQRFSIIEVSSLDPKGDVVITEEKTDKKDEKTKKKVKSKDTSSKKSEKSKVSVADLNLSTRAENAINDANLSLSDLKKMSKDDLTQVDGIGKKTAEEIYKKVRKHK